MTNKEMLEKIKRYLEDHGIDLMSTIHEGKTEQIDISDFIRAMIYSQLSARKSWYEVREKLEDVDKLFFYYDKEMILQTESNYFYNGIKELHIASQLTRNQMNSLHKNLKTIEVIETQYKTLNNFLFSRKPIYIAYMLSNDLEYKLDYIGLALACELLRNLGVDLVKPDVHLQRFFSAKRTKFSNKEKLTDLDVYEIADHLSKETGYSMRMIDSIIWNYCAEGYGAVCGEKAKCDICVIRQKCNYNEIS